MVTIREIAESINVRINTVSDGVSDGYEILKEVSATDMSQTIIAQGRLATLMGGMIEQKNKFSAILKNSASISHEASDTLSGMVVNLQFQDRTTQYIESSLRLLDYMDGNIATLKRDNITYFPELSEIKPDKFLAENVEKQFQLSEFAKLFQLSLEGTPLSTTNTTDTPASVKAEEVELF